MTFRRARYKTFAIGGVLLIAAFVVSACASRGGAFHISSLSSAYAPAAALWGRTHISDSLVIIDVDSMLVRDPGRHSPSSPASLAEITVRALLVTDAREGWHPQAASSEVPVVDTLRWGESRVVHRLRFAVPRPPAVSLAETWIVLEFRGRALLLGGGRLVRTYACSARNLRGRSPLAERRAELLRANYLAVCQRAPTDSSFTTRTPGPACR